MQIGDGGPLAAFAAGRVENQGFSP